MTLRGASQARRAGGSRRRAAPKSRRVGRTAPRHATPARAARILGLLEKAHPEATCALHHRTPFELVVATILSAQCTDKRVNEVTPALFARFPTPQAMAAASPAEIEDLIRSTGFFRAKAKSLLGSSARIVAEHAGRVPSEIEALVKLPGIGRKTANVVLGHAYGIAAGIAVDTHVLRVSKRLGLASGDDPLAVEAELMHLVPRERWTRTSDLLIFHGRKVCDARRPACGSCPAFALCAFESKQAWAHGGARPKRPGTAPRPRRR